jgi:hypothetical protein
MGVPFYDNYEPEQTGDGWLDFERIYCFDWDKFNHDLFERLESVFASLPGWIGKHWEGGYYW